MSTIDMVQQFCCNCHMEFYMPRSLYDRAQELRMKLQFYCPAGHGQHFMGESDADKFRRERDRLAQQIAQKDDEIAAERKKTKRLERRVKAGVCPCCQRTFSNMAAHIKTQHPTFAPDKKPKLKVVA